MPARISVPRFSDGVAAFAPTDIAGSEVWFDASDASTITSSGGLVSQWNDKSGNASHVSEATNKPSTGVVTIGGGYNAIQFDNSDILRRGSLTLTIATMTFFGVVDATGNHRGFFTSASGGGVGFTTNGSSGGFGLLFPSVAFEDTATADDSPLIFVCRRTGGTATVYKNGGSALLTKTNTPAGGVDTLCVGKDDLGTAAINAGEFIWYNTALSDANVNKVGNYLGTKWGLTWTNL